MIELVHNAIYTMDQAYMSFTTLHLIHQCYSFFITRANDLMLYEIAETNYNIDDSVGHRGEQII